MDGLTDGTVEGELVGCGEIVGRAEGEEVGCEVG